MGLAIVLLLTDDLSEFISRKGAETQRELNRNLLLFLSVFLCVFSVKLCVIAFTYALTFI